MSRLFPYLFLIVLGVSCTKHQEESESEVEKSQWQDKFVDPQTLNGLDSGKTYLSVYSQIYSRTQHVTHALTATVSLRNVSETDTVYVSRAVYFNTHGHAIRSYFDEPVFIGPMETVEIVIQEVDMEGGTGGNFIFDWHAHKNADHPRFECVMISTSGQQGLSFTTQGIEINP